MKRIILSGILFFLILNLSAALTLEAGTVEVGDSWKRVTFTKSFSDPVVVVKSVEGCGNPSVAKDLCDFITARVRNVSSTGFDVMLQTTRKKDSLSEPKTVPYIVVEKGRHSIGGFEIEAGTEKTQNFPFFSPKPSMVKKFDPAFTQEPVVITTATTFKGEPPTTTRNLRKDYIQLCLTCPKWRLGDFKKGFVSRVDEVGWDPVSEHKSEDISYIAITPGVGFIDGQKVYVGKGERVNHKASRIDFSGVFSSEPLVVADMQRIAGQDWSVLRYASLTKDSVKLMVAETQCDLFGCYNGGRHDREPIGYVLIGEGPVEGLKAFFTAEPDSGAPPLEVNFDASGSTGNIVSYEWDLGDGNTTDGKAFFHTYLNEGDYTAKLTVENAEGQTDSTEKTIKVHTIQELLAVIDANATSCDTTPCTINFDGSKSTGNIVSFEWDFGDCKTSTDVNAEHTFEKGGVYEVRLTVEDAEGNTDSATVTINVREKLRAIIEADPDSCVFAPCSVSFDGSKSMGEIESFEWIFDGNKVKEGTETEHAFYSLGMHSVKLTVSDSEGNSDSACKFIFVGCKTNEDCNAIGEDAQCYNGKCIHPLITINKSRNQTIPFREKDSKDITTAWTLSNVGEHKAIIQDFWVPGCRDYTCTLELVEKGGKTITPNTGKPPSVTETQGINDIGEGTGDGCSLSSSASNAGNEGATLSKRFEAPKKIFLQKAQDSNFFFEHGEVEVGLEWKTVNYSHSYENPIVVAKPIESCAGQAQEMCDIVVVRVKNVTPNSFEVKLQTWGLGRGKDLSSPHKVQYMVIEEGHYSDVNGFEIEAGKFTLTLGILEDMFGGAFAQVTFRKDFSEKPVVFTNVATFVGENPVVTRNKKVSIAGFKTRLSEQGQRWIGNVSHKNEEIHYIAVTPGNGEIGDHKAIVSSLSNVNHVSSEAVFQRAGFRSEPIVVADMQTNNGTDPSVLRYTNKTKLSTKFFVAEDGLLDYSFRHLNGERVGYMAIGIPPIYVVSPVIEADPTECKEAPCEVNFNGLSSYSNAGSIVSYEWDFGDCTEGSGGTVSHTYEAPSAYVVTLITTDELGNQGTDSIIINVGKKLPLKAIIEHNKDGAAGHLPCQSIPCSVSFDGSKSKGDIVAYEWNFHDGSTQTGKTAEFTYEEFGEFPVTLTIKDDSGKTDSVTTLVIVRKVEGLILLEPMETLTVYQHIKNVARPDKAKALSLGLVVQYTDLLGAGKRITKNHRNTSIILNNVKTGQEKFHIKLDLVDQVQCVGWNDVYGVTGEQASPKVLFDWSFNSGENSPVAIKQCDKNVEGEITYCDATQFSISLLKKLRKIDQLAHTGELGISKLEEFQSHLMADHFSEDFRKDFDYYYKNGFFNAPSWYTDMPKPWSEYFTNSSRLKFEPAKITEPGLYKVALEFTFEGEEYEFFSEGNPAATITVKLEKVHNLGIEVIDSPFYHLPFNGLIGTMREDSDGKVERKDYGIGFENEDPPLSVSYVGNDIVVTTPANGKTTYLTRKKKDFEELNLSERGKVLSVDILNGVMEFAPSYAMPVIMGIESVSDQAQAFYTPFKGDTMLDVSPFATYWTAAAASPYLECTDFMNNPLPYNEADVLAESFSGVCPMGEEKKKHSFGFRWGQVVKNEERLFLKTIFYSAFEHPMNLSNACNNPEYSVSLFASPFDLSSSPSEFVSLQAPESGIETFKDLKQKIAESKICMSSSNGNYSFFWNPEKVEEGLENAKAKIEEKWAFNWENYKCNPFE